MKTLLNLIFLIFHFSVPSLAWQFEKTKVPSKSELKKILSPLQFKVTQESSTEPPFKNEYAHNDEEGIYVDIVSGEPLFSSKDKFDSGTGWPSFSRPLVKENLVELEDRGLFGNRTEVRSKFANSHLGHVFDDGPKPTGLRYCMNSASLKFIPKSKLKELGYSEFLSDFSRKELELPDQNSAAKIDKEKIETAIFAGGCFWCMQSPFDHLKDKGVLGTRVGYTGGSKSNPTYDETSSGTTGHREAIEITYDSKKISYKELLNIFWKNIDPYDSRGQFCDKGEQYTSAVFYGSDSQRKDFEESKTKIEKQSKIKDKIVTTLLPFTKFYAAEDYHQSYYQKNPVRYKYYRFSCGRDKRLNEIWGTTEK